MKEEIRGKNSTKIKNKMKITGAGNACGNETKITRASEMKKHET